jgi:SPW repeat-containing protein
VVRQPSPTYSSLLGSGPKRNRWQFWGLVFSVFLIVLTPSLAGDADWEIGAINAAAVGILLIALAGFELVHHQSWTDVCELGLGLWLVASPYLLGYANAGNFARGHGAIGVLLAVLALLSVFGGRLGKRFDG